MQPETRVAAIVYALQMLGEVGTLEEAGEILELRVHMIFRMDGMQVIKESNGSKSVKYHTALDAFVSRFLNTAENRSYTVV